MSPLPTRRSILLAFVLAPLMLSGSCAPKRTTAPSVSERSLAGATPTRSAPSAATPAPPMRVLFIGNSYTFYNGGVDAVLTALAASRNRAIECVTSTSGGKTLQWHWEEGDARAAIARGGWDFVVLQEFSTRPITSPDRMFEFARKLDAEIESAGAETVFYLTWARFHQPENQIVITRAYNKIADELQATVARVGPAWERVLRDHPSIKLHMEDRSHPTPAGTYLAACVFYATLTGDSPEGLPSTVRTAAGKTINLAPADALVLQRAAEAAARQQRVSAGTSD